MGKTSLLGVVMGGTLCTEKDRLEIALCSEDWLYGTCRERTLREPNTGRVGVLSLALSPSFQFSCLTFW